MQTESIKKHFDDQDNFNHSITYAERLGWKNSDKVIMFHVDDAGMSHDSNAGVMQSLQAGIATSVSVMMPCDWVPEIINFLKENPGIDSGIHLTHTSEWNNYRWSPLAGAKQVKSLTDKDAAFYKNVQSLLLNAKLNDVEKEIYAQLEKAYCMDFIPSHIDTHMGVLWASAELLELYISIGIREKIPPLLPAGHNSLLMQHAGNGPLAPLKNNKEITAIGQQLWSAGFPVIDDLYVSAYDWMLPLHQEASDENLRSFKTEKYKELLRNVRPGITVIPVHCTDVSESFKYISKSGDTRKGDLLAMKDPALKKFIEDENIILTNWRELVHRRNKAT